MSILNDKEIPKSFLKSNYKKEDLLNTLNKHNNINDISLLNSDTLDKNSEDIESFRKFYLFQTKKYFDGNSFFGLVHVRLAFFVKEKKRYEKYTNTIINKINKAIKISDEYNKVKGKFYIYLDLEKANPKNFSKKFLKDLSYITDKLYEDQLMKYFISGKKYIIKMFWPIISLFLNKEVKKKIICLK